MKILLPTVLMSLTFSSSILYAEDHDMGDLELFGVNTQTLESSLELTNEEFIRNIVREEILNNPELLIESLQAFEKKVQAEATQQQAQLDMGNLTKFSSELYSNNDTPVFGDAQDGIIVVEFFDYNCRFCRQVAPVFEEVIDTFNVRRVYKEFPILGLESVEVSAISQAIMNNYPDVYEEFHKAIYKLDGVANKDSALSVVEELGLDKDEVSRIADSDENMQILVRNSELAQALNLTGTPAFIIGSTILRGAPTIENFKDLLEK